jgi:hypothetical protein
LSPSDLPWWGWMLIAAFAGIVYKAGALLANAYRLDSPAPARWYTGTVAAFVGLWTAVPTAGIGIASLPRFWSLAVIAGLLVIALAGIASLSDQMRRAENETKEKLATILQKLDEHRGSD